MTEKERLCLIQRIAQWCFDNTESWEHETIGSGLAYLFWAIAASDGDPMDATIGDYSALLRVLEENPNGLLDTLVQHGFLLVPDREDKRCRDAP